MLVCLPSSCVSGDWDLFHGILSWMELIKLFHVIVEVDGLCLDCVWCLSNLHATVNKAPILDIMETNTPKVSDTDSLNICRWFWEWTHLLCLWKIGLTGFYLFVLLLYRSIAIKLGR